LRVLRIAVLPLAVMQLVGCRRTLPADPVILSLDEQVVRRSDFERHVADLEVRGGEKLAPDVREALLDPFLEERVLVLEARSRGLVAIGASADQEQAAVQALLRDEVHSKVEVTDGEVETYYRDHLDELREPERVTLRQILVPTSNEAREVRRRLGKDPKGFDVLARTMSRAPEASAGGMMGTFAKGQLPAELEAAAFALPAGGTSDVVESSLGYHVLRVEAREAAREPTLAEARGRIRTQLSRQKADRSVRQFVLGLMARAKVNHEAANPRRRTG
jgi:parvulin-like peptidyl-prolyl isomerase